MKPSVMKKVEGSDQSRQFQKIWWVVQFHLSLSQDMHSPVRSRVTSTENISCPQHILSYMSGRHLGIDGHSFWLRVGGQKEKKAT